MSDAHFASLSSTLLARKGGAKPAMRPQSAALGPVDGVAAAANLEDLGWNDMGEDVAPETAAPPLRQVGSASLAESSLIKKPALPPLEEREDLGDTDSAASPARADADVVSINARQTENRSEQENGVRQSLDRIVSQLETRQPAADERQEADAVEKAAPAAVMTTPKPASPAKASGGAKGKRAAFTLRLDPERHLMLKLACTVRGSSAQQLVTDALDGLLAEMPEIAMLAAQVQRRPN